MEPTKNITQLLAKWSAGDQTALDELMPLVYKELRRLASNYLRRERVGHTLQPTALVNVIVECHSTLAGPRPSGTDFSL